MTDTTLSKSVVTLIAAATSNAATATTRGTADMRTSLGGFITIKLNNAGTLGAQAEARILIAHNTGATPTAASAGTDWKTVYVVGNGTVSGTTGEWSWDVPQGIHHIEVEVTGNTTNAVTCEAFLSRNDKAVSV